jgi:hypothetical protein
VPTLVDVQWKKEKKQNKMKRFDSAKWITENKYGKLPELNNPKKADLNKDGKLSSYEKTRGSAIEKNMSIKESIDPKSNLKDVPAETIVNGMLSGDENNEIIAMLKAYKADALSAEETKNWAENIGREKLVSRISSIQGKIPDVAPSKAEMPALEPTDSESVKDALDDTDGGKYAIDISEPFAPTIKKEIKPDFNNPLFPTNLDKTSGEDWLQKGKQDGEEGDDKIEVLTGQSATVGEMTPTQSNIQIGKSLYFATVVVPLGVLDKLDGFATDDANGNAILDGHHRWSGQYSSFLSPKIG